MKRTHLLTKKDFLALFIVSISTNCKGILSEKREGERWKMNG